jgi:hypothetical protein
MVALIGYSFLAIMRYGIATRQIPGMIAKKLYPINATMNIVGEGISLGHIRSGKLPTFPFSSQTDALAHNIHGGINRVQLFGFDRLAGKLQMGKLGLGFNKANSFPQWTRNVIAG